MRYIAADVDLEEIGHRIRAERLATGWSQDELISRLKAQGAPLSRGTLSKIENGGVMGFDLNLLVALCNLFNCDMGYLLCEYDEHHRVTAEVCAKTGLAESAAIRLDQEVQIEKGFSHVFWDGILPLEVMSKLLCDEEFWRVLYNLSVATTSTARGFGQTADAHNSYLQVPLSSDEVDMRPFADTMDEMHIASATIHFGNAVRRALGWESDSKPQKKEEKTTETPEFYDGQSPDRRELYKGLLSDTDGLAQVMKTEK